MFDMMRLFFALLGPGLDEPFTSLFGVVCVVVAAVVVEAPTLSLMTPTSLPSSVKSTSTGKLFLSNGVEFSEALGRPKLAKPRLQGLTALDGDLAIALVVGAATHLLAELGRSVTMPQARGLCDAASFFFSTPMYVLTIASRPLPALSARPESRVEGNT